MKRAAKLLALASVASCVAPETARFYGGYWSTSDIDNRQCRMRSVVQVTPPGGDPPPVLVVQPPPPETSSAPMQPSALPPSPPPASASGNYHVDVAGLGAFDVTIHARGTVGVEGVTVGANARVEVPVAPPAWRPRPIPGFVFGVDVRAYRHVVFVVDNTADMCDATPAGGTRVVLDDVIDQVLASLSGLPLDHRISVVAASGKVRQLIPGDGAAGRRVAMEWTCSLLCEGDSSMTLGLVRAFDEHPDVVVLLSNGAMPPPEHNGRVDALPDLASVAADPAEVLARMEWTAPVVAVDVGHGAHADRLRRIAELTGGSYVLP